jgi:MoaA/NifB/PqqE/SkfB family radical SAM enzyme
VTTTLSPRPTSSGRPDDEPLADGERLERLPILILYPHSRCNCRCLMCDIWRQTTRDELDPADVAAAVEGWRALGVRRVVLSGGEPLMHGRLWELVAPLHAAGIGVTLLSTGLLLARHAEAIGRYVDDVVVSLDGPPPVHDAIRGRPGTFQRLREGVRALREAAPGTFVSARCTLQRANCALLRPTVVAAKEVGVGRLSFLAVDATSEAFARPGGWGPERAEPVVPGEAELAAMRAELDALVAGHAEDFAAGFLAESPAKLERVYEQLRAAAGLGPWPGGRCNAPWVSAVVEADGTVRPCFFHRPIGRWTGGDLRAVVDGPEARAFRRSLDVATDPTCRRCVCRLNLRPEAPAG